MRFRSFGIVLAIGLSFPLQSALAQAAAPASLQPSAELYAATAALSPVDAPSLEHATGPIASATVREGTRKEGVTLMIVGAAGMLTGLLIDESAITILSAGLAGLGLYLYVR
jgi:hypothetical protein